jgi:hypoxanthine phosphoribosyltransferase
LQNQSEKFEIPTWEEIYSMLLLLAKKIRADGFDCDLIVGVSRGGWIPARILSDLLENSSIANVRAEFYLGIGESKKEPLITQRISVPVKGKNLLVVDDVSDTGKSLRLVRAHLCEESVAELRIAALYYKPWSILEPNYYIKKTRRWIIFPWERKEAFRKIIEKTKQEGRSLEEIKRTLVDSGFDQKLIDIFSKEGFRDYPSG